MNAKIVHNWNSVVLPGDVVYLLGDVVGPRGKNVDVLKELHGNIVFIQGNHDNKKVLGKLPNWSPRLYLNVGGFKFLLQHYPEYPRAVQDPHTPHSVSLPEDKINYSVDFILSGHIHNNHFKRDGKQVGRLWTGRSLNLGVEVHNYTPVSLDAVLQMCRKRRRQIEFPGYKPIVPADNPDEQLDK